MMPRISFRQPQEPFHDRVQALNDLRAHVAASELLQTALELLPASNVHRSDGTRQMQFEPTFDERFALCIIGFPTTIDARAYRRNERLDLGLPSFTGVERRGAAPGNGSSVIAREWITIELLERLTRATSGFAEHFRRSVGASFEAFP